MLDKGPLVPILIQCHWNQLRQFSNNFNALSFWQRSNVVYDQLIALEQILKQLLLQGLLLTRRGGVVWHTFFSWGKFVLHLILEFFHVKPFFFERWLLGSWICNAVYYGIMKMSHISLTYLSKLQNNHLPKPLTDPPPPKKNDPSTCSALPLPPQDSPHPTPTPYTYLTPHLIPEHLSIYACLHATIDLPSPPPPPQQPFPLNYLLRPTSYT